MGQVTRAKRAHAVACGGRYVVNTLVSSAPNVSDLDRGRRRGTHEDQCNMIRLMQMLNAVHMGGVNPVKARDLPMRTRNLDLLHAFPTLADKTFFGRGIGREMVRDALEMVAIALGIERVARRKQGIGDASW